MSFWGELKRRDVFKVAVAYLVASWLIVQIVGVLTEPLNLPNVLDTVVVVLLAIGFPFALIIAWIYDVTPEGIRVTASDGGVVSAPSTSGKRLTSVVIVLTVLGIGLMAFNRFTMDRDLDRFGVGSRLAILPCTDLSPDPSAAFFAPGIHQELIAQLGSLSGLDVISQNSVQQYAARPTPAEQIAEELEVPAVMECSALYSGNQVRLMVALVDGESALNLWQNSYRADMSEVSEIFQIQANIAMQVANALNVAFLQEQVDLIAEENTQSREAYEAFLAAQESGIDPERRRELLDEALRIDNGFVDALLLRSRTNTETQEFERAMDDAREALRLSPGDGRGYVWLAYSLMWQGEWVEAEQNNRRALDVGLEPSSFPSYGFLQMVVGHFGEARQGMAAYLSVNPIDALTASLLMMTHELLGDEEARQREFERGERLYANWPSGIDDVLIRLAEGDPERLRGLAPEIPASVVGVSNLGSPASGIEALRALRADLELGDTASAIDIVTVFLSSAWAAHFGDSKLALEWLEEALRYNPVQLSRVWYPAFDSVRREPGFEQLLADLGLPEYWDRYGWPEICRQVNDEGFECD